MTSESSFSEALIDLVFDKFANFVEQYSAQVSLAGMFLKTTDLKAVGTPVSIEIKLSDGYRLIQAVGEVTWVCLEGAGQHPQGLAIRFHALDESGRGLLLKIIEEQSKSGGATFDIAQVPPGAIVERGQPEAIPTADPAQAPGDEIAFDAPWGDKLPDLPDDILESEPSVASEKPPAPPLAAAGRRAAPPPTELPVALPLEDEEDPGEQAAFSMDAPDIELSDPALETVDPKASLDVAPTDDDLDATAPSLRRDARSAAQPPPEGVDLASESASPKEATPEEPMPEEAMPAETPSAVDDPLFGELPPSFELADEAGFSFEEDPEEIDFTQDLPTVDAPAPDLPPVDEAVADGTGGLDEVYEIDEPSEEASAAPSPLEALSSPSPLAPVPAPSHVEPPDEPLLPDLDESASIGSPSPSPPPPASSSGSFLEQTSSEPIAPSPTETREGPPGLFDEGPSYPPVAASPAPPSPATDEIDDVSDDGTDVGDSTNAPYYYSDDEAGGGPRRWLVPAAVAVVVVILAGVGYLQRDTLMGLIGLGTAAPQDVAPPAATPPEEDLGLADPPLQAPDDLAAPEPPSTADTAISAREDSGLPDRSTPSEPAPPIASPSRPAERIQDISWRSSPSGTRVLIQADGALQPARLQHNRLIAPTVRELIKVSQIVEPYQQNTLEVGTPELIRIRLGHHPRPEGSAELHIVFDLPDGAVELAELTPRGERLEVFLRRSP